MIKKKLILLSFETHNDVVLYTRFLVKKAWGRIVDT